MNEMDDSALEAALLRKPRPVLPDTLAEARELMEGFMTPGVAQQWRLSAPEARMEATRVLARFERLAHERGRQDGMAQARYEDGDGDA